MTTAGPAFDASGWRRFWTLGAVLVVTGALAAALGLPLPTNPEGWLPVLAVAVVGLVLWAWVLPRVVRPVGARLALLAVVAVASGWYLISPLFMDRVVDEALPGLEPVAAGTPAPTAAATDAETDAAPASSPAVTPDPRPTEASPAEPQRQPARPRRLAAGTFAGINHRAAGTAVLYELADGSRVVRLEEIDFENGPDLFVYLVPEPGQSDDAGAVNLGRLKGNKGNANYPVPRDVDSDDYATVLVWCRAFSTPFANATLELD